MTEDERRYNTAPEKPPLVATDDALLDAQVKKITVADDGKLSISMECHIDDADTLEQVKNLIAAQRGPISVLFRPIQQALDL